MIEGQKVVCIDDNFPAWARAMYDNLPVKDEIYTVRSVEIGCSPKVVVSQDITLAPNKFIGTAEITICLMEIYNKKNEVSKKEMGFKAERFKPLDNIEEKEEVIAKQPITIKKPELIPA